jgi:hypothetical protein
MYKTLLVAAVGFLLLASPATSQAEDFRQYVKEAQQGYGEGDFIKAQRALRGAMMAISNEAPLSVHYFDPVTEEALNFANFTVRKGNVYKVDEPILLYAEPMGYAFFHEGDVLQFGFEADFELIDANGKILGGQKEFQSWVIDSKAPTVDFFMNLTYTFTGLGPGKYTVRTTLHDLVDQEQTSFDYVFKVR